MTHLVENVFEEGAVLVDALELLVALAAGDLLRVGDGWDARALDAVLQGGRSVSDAPR